MLTSPLGNFKETVLVDKKLSAWEFLLQIKMEYFHPKGLNILASIATALANAIKQKTSSNTTNTTEKLQGK